MQRAHHPSNEMKSAARLAAEAAFAPALPPPQLLFGTDAPEITVLRAKRVAVRPDGTNAALTSFSAADISTELQQSAPKVPRVFLLKPASVEFSLPLRDTQPANAQDVRSRDVAASTPVRRAKRRQNKPPPVTLIFAASSSATTSAATGAARTSSGGPTLTPTEPSLRLQANTQQTLAQKDPAPQRSADLRAALAELIPTFAAIRSAAGFTVADFEFAAQWHRLSLALDSIAADISAASRKLPGR